MPSCRERSASTEHCERVSPELAGILLKALAHQPSHVMQQEAEIAIEVVRRAFIP